MAIRLTPFGESHLPAFAELLTDFPRTWLSRYEAGRRDGTSEAFAIVDEAGEFLGVALAFGIEQDARTGELGYDPGRPLRDRLSRPGHGTARRGRSRNPV